MKLKTGKQLRKSNETKGDPSKKINKIDKQLARLTKITEER